MRKMGWREGRGLGRREQGRRTAVQAYYQLDNQGVGYGRKQGGAMEGAGEGQPGSEGGEARMQGSGKELCQHYQTI